MKKQKKIVATLKFSEAKNNAKLQQIKGKAYVFSLPASYSCPMAELCNSRAVEQEDGKWKIEDGKKMQFRCFAASQEVLYTNTRNQRWHNFNLLRDCKNSAEKMKELILKSLPKKFDIIRVHDSGDYFSKNYMKAWVEVAKLNPDKIFYSYTKSLNFWVDLIDEIPTNLKLNASKGGKLDSYIEKYNLKFVEVVFTEEQANIKQLMLDHSDSLAYSQDKSFAILLHGVQKSGTEAALAMSQLRRAGKNGYNKKKIKAEMKQNQKANV